MIMQKSNSAKYIGKTVSFYDRRHTYMHYGEGRDVTDAIRHYGWDDFIMLPIEIFDFEDPWQLTKEEEKKMKDREKFWIDYYNTDIDTFHFNHKFSTNLIECVENKCILYCGGYCTFRKFNVYWKEYHCYRGHYTSKERLHIVWNSEEQKHEELWY